MFVFLNIFFFFFMNLLPKGKVACWVCRWLSSWGNSLCWMLIASVWLWLAKRYLLRLPWVSSWSRRWVFNLVLNWGFSLSKICSSLLLCRYKKLCAFNVFDKSSNRLVVCSCSLNYFYLKIYSNNIFFLFLKFIFNINTLK